jgi:hypothetical protein
LDIATLDLHRVVDRGGHYLIIAAIAIPNLLRSKIAANQASAVGSLRPLNTWCIAYSTSYGQFPALSRAWVRWAVQ